MGPGSEGALDTGATVAHFDRVGHPPYDARAMRPPRIAAVQLAEYAARGADISTSLPAAELPRLAAMLAPGGEVGDGELEVQFEFRQGPEGFPEVRIQMTGQLHLVCQRCLMAVPWELAADVMLTVVSSDAAADGLSSPFDSVVLKDGVLDLPEVIEDEIIASLPLAPAHPAEQACRARAGEQCAAGTEREVNRPFAGLETLLGPGSKTDRN